MKRLLFLLVLSAVAGCGFHLRGAADLPFSSVYVPAATSGIALDLARNIRAGTNVVGLLDTGWDTHGDGDGSVARTKMKALVPALDTFITRMVADTTRNVTLVIMGDFARSLPGSNHQPNLTATVIGPSVKPGTTGRTDADVNLKTDTPAATGLWTYLAALAKVGASPFGANQHPSLVA